MNMATGEPVAETQVALVSIEASDDEPLEPEPVEAPAALKEVTVVAPESVPEIEKGSIETLLDSDTVEEIGMEVVEPVTEPEQEAAVSVEDVVETSIDPEMLVEKEETVDIVESIEAAVVFAAEDFEPKLLVEGDIAPLEAIGSTEEAVVSSNKSAQTPSDVPVDEAFTPLGVVESASDAAATLLPEVLVEENETASEAVDPIAEIEDAVSEEVDSPSQDVEQAELDEKESSDPEPAFVDEHVVHQERSTILPLPTATVAANEERSIKPQGSSMRRYFVLLFFAGAAFCVSACTFRSLGLPTQSLSRCLLSTTMCRFKAPIND